MASIRKRLDEGYLMDCDIEYFFLNKGRVPLCCFLLRISDPVTFKKYDEPRYQCDQLKNAVTFKAFKHFCLQCQKHIAEKIGEMQNENCSVHD